MWKIEEDFYLNCNNVIAIERELEMFTKKSLNELFFPFSFCFLSEKKSKLLYSLT